MIYQLTCRKCQTGFESENPRKKVCRQCILKRNIEISKRYRATEKGKETYKRRYDARIKKPRRKALLWACIDCGKQRKYKAKRCRSCFSKYFRGKNSPSWKGGKASHGDGYVLIQVPNHPRANNGYVLEHIIIWEQVNGKPLPKGWIVHHLNGIKDDNRPSNLVGLASKKHYLILAAKAKRIQELEGLLKNQQQLC